MDNEEALIFIDSRVLQLGNKIKGVHKLLLRAEFEQLKHRINTIVAINGGQISDAEAEGLFLQFKEAIGL